MESIKGWNIFCINCGKQVAENDKFCENCGYKVDEAVILEGQSQGKILIDVKEIIKQNTIIQNKLSFKEKLQ